MKRRISIWILVTSLLSCGAYPAAAEVHDPAVQAVIEEAAENTEETAAEDTASDSSAEDSGLTEDLAAAIEKAGSTYSFTYDPEKGLQPGNPETEELMSNLGVLVEVMNSEEFKRLMEYPEMQALLETLLKRLTTFVMDEPELAAKVLVALGADESAVHLMMKGVDAMR